MIGNCNNKDLIRPELDELRLQLETCGKNLSAKDLRLLLDYLEGLSSQNFGIFMGIATPQTNPFQDNLMVNNYPGWYITNTVGTYPYFYTNNNTHLRVSQEDIEGNIVILTYNYCTRFWSKLIYTISQATNKKYYKFDVSPDSTEVGFSKTNVLGSGTVSFFLDVESTFKGELTAYLSENNLPWWIKYGGVEKLDNGKVRHHFFVCENGGAERCSGIQFVQLGSNNIEIVNICQEKAPINQNTKPKWKFRGNVCSSSNEEFVESSTGMYSFQKFEDANPFSKTYLEIHYVRDEENDGMCNGNMPLPYKWIANPNDFVCEQKAEEDYSKPAKWIANTNDFICEQK